MIRVYFLIMVCMVARAWALDITTLTPGETVCQEHLEACTDSYDSSQKNVRDSRTYYECVWEAPCQKHHRGYNDRLELLSAIDDILEAQHEDRGDWWNGACSTDSSHVVWIVTILATVQILHDAINR